MSPIKINHPSAYTTIKGKVIDAKTKQGISGVLIRVTYRSGRTALIKTTDTKGNYYSKQKSLLGRHYVIASKAGYKTARKSCYCHWGRTDTIKFELESLKKNTPPYAASVSPYSITLYTGQPITLRAVYGDNDGSQDIVEAKCLINTNISYPNSSLLKYEPATNKLYLRNDTDSQWLGGYIPGSNNTIENSQVIVDCDKTSVSKSQTNIEIRWNIAFKSKFKGTKDVYVYVKDSEGADYGWARRGTWRIREKTIAPPKVNAYKTLTNQKTHLISGQKGSKTSVWINEKESVKNNSQKSWTATVNLTTEGPNSFQIKLKDAYGNESAAVPVKIDRDTKPPSMPIADRFQMLPSKTECTMYGYKEKFASIWIDGKEEVGYTESVRWTHTVTLPKEGKNEITIFAKDKAGNQCSSAKITITRDTTAPVIKITAPANNAVVNTSSITVSYTVDGEPKSKTVNLTQEQNTITIEET
ncbi:MAG: carboxypeptidase regulatory-like domain-containing protein, partial [Candidatus Omnitrophica bacterium]|nr:carboxypeptidase regulatory-like domain-containing protein [Candidatus Omnitrophota bacterium]